MTFQEAVKDGFAKYADFSGRSSRSGYWYWYLFEILAFLTASLVDGILGTGPILVLIGALAIVLPSIAVAISRLHDIGRSGWWLLISLVPLIGLIVLLVFYLTASDGPNEYGDAPDGGPAAPAPPATY